MNKYIITIIVALTALGIGAKAQTVYSCQYKSEADVKVHVTKYKSEADLVVYKCKCKRALFFCEIQERGRHCDLFY